MPLTASIIRSERTVGQLEPEVYRFMSKHTSGTLRMNWLLMQQRSLVLRFYRVDIIPISPTQYRCNRRGVTFGLS